jgi:hypothetical protein
MNARKVPVISACQPIQASTSPTLMASLTSFLN